MGIIVMMFTVVKLLVKWRRFTILWLFYDSLPAVFDCSNFSRLSFPLGATPRKRSIVLLVLAFIGNCNFRNFKDDNEI